MSEQTMPANGSFCWNELSTTDDAAAMKFYGELLGWEFKSSDMPPCEGSEAPPVVYNEIVVGGRHVGGVFKMGSEFGGGPPRWMAYVPVEELDAKAANRPQHGRSLCVPPTGIPTTRRVCLINNPA